MKIDSFMLDGIFDDFVWSFSRLNSFYTCKRAWYIRYVLGEYGGTNFFSEYGTFFHKIMEKYDKGELELDNLLKYYTDNYYKEILSDSPPNRYVDIKESYFEKGLKYLSEFKGHSDLTIESEKKISFFVKWKEKNVNIIGYIDRLSKDDSGYVITDYKSKSAFKNDSEKNHYLIQLYLYSIGLYDCLCEYPKKLKFDMFKIGEVVEEVFNEECVELSKKWIYDTLELIYSEETFDRMTDDIDKNFFCNNLCSCKEKCREFY